MLLDNKSQGRVGDVFAQSLRRDSSLAVISRLFSIYGFMALQSELSRLGKLRMLLPNYGRENGEFTVPGLSGGQAERQFRNRLNMASVAKGCFEWLNAKADIRAVNLPVPQNLFHVSTPDGESIAISGSSSFDLAGLGVVSSPGLEMNTCFKTSEETASLLEWFETIWANAEVTRDVTSAVLSQLRRLFEDNSPEFIYFLTLYNVFHDSLDEIDEERILKTRTGIKDTLIWSKLYQFQRDGVLGAINKIERYNGCIIADSVGLGKTFEALAIIKYYELRNDRVLVLTPKRLRENWTIYTVNDKRNLFADDRFNFDVLNHTDLTRIKGQSGEIILETVNWGNYDLVVIDESHNFRNSSPPRTA